MLFHGKRGSRKSWLALGLCASILNRGRFLGEWQTRGRGGAVLYVQADLPEAEQQSRLVRLTKQMPWIRDQDFHFYCPTYMDVTRLEEDEELAGALQEINPCFVVWDVLRKIHHMQEGVHVPGIVYGSTRSLFPEAAHMFVHHDRKTTKDSTEGFLDTSEEFSGVGPWLDLVISAWHIKEQAKTQYTLETTKNNCGPIPNILQLVVDPETQLLVCMKSRLQAEVARWRHRNECNPRKLTRKEREGLRRYLLASFVTKSAAVERVVGDL